MINPITGQSIPEKWKLVKVNDLKSEEKYSCVAGPFGSDISSKYFQEKGVPIIRGNNLSLNKEKFIDEGFAYVSNERALKYKAQHVKKDDLIFTCWGTIGQVGIIPEKSKYPEYIISNKQLKLRVNLEIANPTFLYHYFSSPFMVKYINNIAIGAAVPGINLGLLKNLPIVIPPKKTQDFIANFLDNFDDLIENNNQRIKLLEEMAEEIYKEWFVRLRFPGYKEANFLDKDGNEVPHGTEGALPEGWENKKLGELLNISSSKRIFLSDYVEKGIPFYRGKEIILKSKNKPLNDRLYISEDKFKEIKRKFGAPITGDILITAVGTIGYPYLVTEEDKEFYFKDGNLIWLKNSDKIEPSYLIHFLKSKQFQNLLQGIAIGSSQKALTIVSLKDVDILNPSNKTLKEFEKIITPMLNEVRVLQKKNQILQKTRDLLLPRLISGKLSVEHLLNKDLENQESLSMAAEPEAQYNRAES